MLLLIDVTSQTGNNDPETNRQFRAFNNYRDRMGQRDSERVQEVDSGLSNNYENVNNGITAESKWVLHIFLKSLNKLTIVAITFYLHIGLVFNYYFNKTILII